MTPNEAIAIGGKNCYSTIKRVFSTAGYDDVLLSVGDHELGNGKHKSAVFVFIETYYLEYKRSYNIQFSLFYVQVIIHGRKARESMTASLYSVILSQQN